MTLQEPEIRRSYFLRCGLLAGVVLIQLLAAAPAHPQPRPESLDLSRVAWSRLDYKASKLLLSGSARLTLEPVPAGSGTVGRTADLPPLAAGRDTVLLTLRYGGLGKKSLLRLWLDARRGEALSRTQLEARRATAYRYQEDGVAYRRRFPEGDSQAQARPEEWTGVEETHHPYPPNRNRGLIVTEPSAIFYFVAAGEPLALGEKREFYALLKRQLHRLEMSVVERLRMSVDYKEEAPHGERRRKGRVQVLRVVLGSESLDPHDTSEFEFLGLRGDIELFVDERTRTPVQVSGRLPPVGRMRVKLKRMVLR